MKKKYFMYVFVLCVGAQSCTIYNKLPTPVDFTVNRGKVKMVQKISDSNISTLSTEYKSISKMQDQTYFGLRKNDTVEALIFDEENTSFYLKDRTKSTFSTIILCILGGVAANLIIFGITNLALSGML